MMMNKQILVALALAAMVVAVLADYGEQHHEEEKYVQIPALKLKLKLDHLTFKLPNLFSMFKHHGGGGGDEHHY